jgi:hypothetical protein
MIVDADEIAGFSPERFLLFCFKTPCSPLHEFSATTSRQVGISLQRIHSAPALPYYDTISQRVVVYLVRSDLHSGQIVAAGGIAVLQKGQGIRFPPSERPDIRSNHFENLIVTTKTRAIAMRLIRTIIPPIMASLFID